MYEDIAEELYQSHFGETKSAWIRTCAAILENRFNNSRIGMNKAIIREFMESISIEHKDDGTWLLIKSDNLYAAINLGFRERGRSGYDNIIGKTIEAWITKQASTLAELDASESKPTELISVKDQLPLLGQRVLLFSNGVIQKELYTYDQSDSCANFGDRDDIDESPLISDTDFWMSLPEPPKT